MWHTSKYPSNISISVMPSHRAPRCHPRWNTCGPGPRRVPGAHPAHDWIHRNEKQVALWRERGFHRSSLGFVYLSDFAPAAFAPFIPFGMALVCSLLRERRRMGYPDIGRSDHQYTYRLASTPLSRVLLPLLCNASRALGVPTRCCGRRPVVNRHTSDGRNRVGSYGSACLRLLRDSLVSGSLSHYRPLHAHRCASSRECFKAIKSSSRETSSTQTATGTRSMCIARVLEALHLPWSYSCMEDAGKTVRKNSIVC